MNRYRIIGGTCLNGEIDIHGSKNAALPILAATVLNSGKNIIHNCPELSDINNMIEILQYLGCKVTRSGKELLVDSSGFSDRDIPMEIMQKTRSSTIFAGALAARCARAFIAGSGGCCIGKRPIDLHLKAFRALGLSISEANGGILCSGDRITNGRIYLDFPSVGATENVMIASAMTSGVTTVVNAAKEPEIINLAAFLNSMGAKIIGAGSEVIQIKGTQTPHDTEVSVIPDRIVASTYAVAVAAAKGKITIKHIDPAALSPVIAVLRRMGVQIRCMQDGLKIESDSRTVNPSFVATKPYPGFPTDCQPLLVALMSISSGIGVVRESIFENRFGHCNRLNQMGAQISTCGRTAVISGVRRLKGACVDACDLRCGAALAVAALAAEGTTELTNVNYIERGYEDLCGGLNSLGASIERME